MINLAFFFVKKFMATNSLKYTKLSVAFVFKNLAMFSIYMEGKFLSLRNIIPNALINRLHQRP